MACANIMLTIAAIVVFVFGMWPSIAGTFTPWIMAVTAIIIVALAWTGVVCKWCPQKK